MSMNAVGIDVSKRKSTVAILRPGGEVVASPFDVPHLSGCFQPLIQHIRALNGQTRIVMECTGRYYELLPANSLKPDSSSALLIHRSSCFKARTIPFEE